MGCGNCGTSHGGKPAGCKSNGGCSTGGCNRMNVFDWLNEIPLYDSQPFPIIEVSFNKGSRKEFFQNNNRLDLDKGQMITVEGVSGFDIGMVSLTGPLVKLQMKKYNIKTDNDLKRVLRKASDDDLNAYYTQKDREQEIMVRSRAIAKQLNLDMKICEVEIQADGKKATFFYTADGRVDFRELIKVYAGEFRVKVEMKQIGARQESAKVGGIGSCGRELCCSTWLTDFKSVNTSAARYQNLSINQAKLSGQCGRLKCCLNYELDTYMDALKGFPENADNLDTVKGTAYLQKRDIFRNLMWYSFKDSNKQYPLSIHKVLEIQELNKKGEKAAELQTEEIEQPKSHKADVKVEMGFVNDVGQISLKNLEKSSRKKGKSNQATSRKNQPNPGNVNNNTQPHGASGKPGRNAGGKRPETGKEENNNKPRNEREKGNQSRPKQASAGKSTIAPPPPANNAKKKQSSGRPGGNKSRKPSSDSPAPANNTQ